MRFHAWLGSLVFVAFAACNPPPGANGDVLDTDAAGDGASGDTMHVVDSGPCDSSIACVCADRGPPDFSRANTGHGAPGDSPVQTEALHRANYWRTAAGIGALNANAQIEQAATAHAMFMVSNPQSGCWPGVHNEIQMGCTGFTGASVGDRVTAAGFRWMNVSEVINWEPDADHAVDGWIWTVYHRMPFMNYQFTDTGFAELMGTLGGGRQSQFNVEDFGAALGSSGSPPANPAVFPVPGLTGVPTAFQGYLEGPTPPSPTGSNPWPRGVSSGTVVSVHFPGMNRTVTDHHLFFNAGGACMDVSHTFVSMETDHTLMVFQSPDVFFYANQPLQGGSEYVAQVTGTVNGQPWTRTWAFTTQ